MWYIVSVEKAVSCIAGTALSLIDLRFAIARQLESA